MKTQALYKLPILNFAEKFALFLSLTAAGVYMALSVSALANVAGILLLGLIFAHAIELQHECLHGAAFKNRILNQTAGFILGVPMLVSFHRYRDKHLYHHRHLGRPTDKEFFNYGSNEQLHLGHFIFDLFGVRRIMSCLKDFGVAFGLLKNEEDHFTQKMKTEYFIIGFIFISLSVFSLIYSTDIVFKLWILPLLFVAEPAHFLIEIPEHIFCDKSTPDFYKNTRTIRGSWFSFWYTNGNNLHVEHHKRASLPVEKLPEEFLKTPEEMYVNLELSYMNFYSKLLTSVQEKRQTV